MKALLPISTVVWQKDKNYAIYIVPVTEDEFCHVNNINCIIFHEKSFLERLLSFLYQVSRRGYESTRVQICHQTYVVTVVHQGLLCHHSPYIFPGIQLQDVFNDGIMTILGKSGVLTMLSILNGQSITWI